MLSHALILLPDTFSLDQLFFNQLTATELNTLKTGFDLAVKHAEDKLKVENVKIEFDVARKKKPPLCRRKLPSEVLKQIDPFLNAKVGLARCLWAIGDHNFAIHQLWDVLRLDPADKRLIRFLLASWLFQNKDDKALRHLIRICLRVTNPIAPWNITTMEEHVDHCAFFYYLQALMTFRRYCRRPSGIAKFEHALEEALYENRLVPQYLLGRVSLPREREIRTIPHGSLYEAVHCARHTLELWHSVPGALDCLGDIIDRRAHRLAKTGVKNARRARI